MMVLSSLLFATMAVCIKAAALTYSPGEIVFYRGLVGALAILALMRLRGGSVRTAVPGMHVARSASGVAAMGLWFYSIGGLPLATATALNYMSSVWMAAFLLGGAVMLGARRVEGTLVTAVLLGFAGVALVLRPTFGPDQHGYGLAGLASGLLSALAYLQITALARAGEPEDRIVFYFSVGAIVVGIGLMLLHGTGTHSPRGVLLLLAIGALAVVAQLLMTRAYAVGSTLANAALQYLGILFSFIYGLLLFDEPLTLLAAAGAVLIVVAGLMTSRVRARSPEPEDTRGRLPGEG
jgi:S-adenosylmethionine uptake transporter